MLTSISSSSTDWQIRLRCKGGRREQRDGCWPHGPLLVGFKRRPGSLHDFCIANKIPLAFHPFFFFQWIPLGEVHFACTCTVLASILCPDKERNEPKKENRRPSCSALLRFLAADGLKLATLKQSSHNSRRHSPLGMLLDPHSTPAGPAGLRMAGELYRVVTFDAGARGQVRGFPLYAGT